MVETVKDMSVALKNIESALLADSRTNRMSIDRMVLANTDPSRATNGWVGLYVDSSLYAPRLIGAGSRSWENSSTFVVLIQSVNYQDPLRAHEDLEKYIKNVMDVILEDTTLKQEMDAVTGFQVDYAFDQNNRESLSFLGALITVDYEGRNN